MTRYHVFILSLLLMMGSGHWAVIAAEPTTQITTEQFRTAINSAEQFRTAINSAIQDSHSNPAIQDSHQFNHSNSGQPSIQNRTATNPEPEIQQLQRYFFAAARTGELAVLTEFLSAGYPVNERNAQSYTALMIAAYAGQADAVDALLKAGADACLRDKRGHTALMGAMIKAEWEIARTLYNIDCDKKSTAKATDVVTDKNQMTAAQFAEVFGQSDKFKTLSGMANLQP